MSIGYRFRNKVNSRVSMDGNFLERENTDGNRLENVKSK